MRVLLDTNFLIASEPTHSGEVEANAGTALEVLKCIQKLRWQACIHPAQNHDLGRDPLKDRVDVRRLKLQRYEELRPPFHIPEEVRNHTAGLLEGCNDWVDWQLLAALKSNAVAYLISDDAKLHKRAARIAVDHAVFTAQEAFHFLKEALGETQLPRIPAVEPVKAYALDEKDPIFDSLRIDYPGFDDWLRRCKQQHRDTFRIMDPSTRRLAAFAILKKENAPQHGLSAGSLKICTFKVGESYFGLRFGELLLRAIFAYTERNRYRDAFVTVLPRHELLINFLEQFGFFKADSIPATGEHVFAKRFGYPGNLDVDPVALHVLYGPSVIDLDRSKFFVVPILPKWFSTLFPDCDEQKHLLPGVYPCGNAIRKAYLCNSVTSTLKRGDNLLFYRSQGKRDVAVVGVVEEDPLRSQKHDEIASYVGKRTVYSSMQVEELAAAGSVLAIRFRHALHLKPTITLKELKVHGVLADYPQTLHEVRDEGLPWLRATLRERFFCPSGQSSPEP